MGEHDRVHRLGYDEVERLVSARPWIANQFFWNVCVKPLTISVNTVPLSDA